MLEINDKTVAKIALQIVQKKDKNTFDRDFHDCVNLIRSPMVCFDKVDIKGLISNWGIICSDKQQDALKTNSHLLRFKNGVEDTFKDFDITPTEFFELIKSHY